DAATGREVRVLVRGEKKSFRSGPVFTPDGRRLVAGDLAGGITVWNVADGTPLRELTSPRGPARPLVLSPDGRWPAPAGSSRVAGANAIRLWDLTTYREVKRFTPRRAAFALAFSPDGRRLASAGGESGRRSDRGDVQVWDVESGRELHAFEGHTGEVF